jgi:hypothetical protein
MTGTVGAAVTGVADSSGQGRTATAGGSATYVAGAGGRTAVRFDGSTGYLTTRSAVLDTRASFTVTAWVRLDRIPTASATAVSQDGGSASAFFLQYSAAEHGFAFADQTTRAPDPRAVRTGVWYQLTGVHDAGTGVNVLYVDGVAVASRPVAGPIAASGPLQIGRARSASAPAEWWPGAVGRVEAYARVLTSGEIGQLYRAGP